VAHIEAILIDPVLYLLPVRAFKLSRPLDLSQVEDSVTLPFIKK
jgi:hypothetical protein